ncbi:hypothetical protein BDZ45DRAFT_300036 [Acephala macrosclerotiorum]|nr:hypothetical protein BDZ45DRAFT_300036 [Acephala macrosclerotiorum]
MPSNILWFGSSKDLRGILVLSKMILSQSSREISHSMIPNSRKPQTSGYQPPEVYLEDGRPVIRASDIWAVGCVFLEILTWLLGGSELLKKFKHQRYAQHDFSEFQIRRYLPPIPDDTFFELKRDESRVAPLARVKLQVTEWFDELHKHENCSQLIRDTLDVIKTEMIVVSPEARSESAKLRNTFRIFSNRIDISDDLDKA